MTMVALFLSVRRLVSFLMNGRKTFFGLPKLIQGKILIILKVLNVV